MRWARDGRLFGTFRRVGVIRFLFFVLICGASSSWFPRENGLAASGGSSPTGTASASPENPLPGDLGSSWGWRPGTGSSNELSRSTGYESRRSNDLAGVGTDSAGGVAGESGRPVGGGTSGHGDPGRWRSGETAGGMGQNTPSVGADTAGVSGSSSSIRGGASLPGSTRGAGVTPASVSASSGVQAQSGGVHGLPSSHGQVWREYDIRSYCLQVQSTKRPQAAVVDWILRETGYEVWHGEVPALLCASREKVLVFHTPAVQDVVGQVLERFLTNGAQPVGINFRLVVVSNPSWQAAWLHALTPVKVHSQGIRAWVLYREDVSLLVADLRRRPDYREHPAPQLSVPNGQTTVVSATRARPYTRHLAWRPESWPGFTPETGFVDEGFTLEISPLLSSDRRQVDVVLRLEIWQVERLVPLTLEIAGGPGQPARPRLEIPQRVQLSFHERFRWSPDQALLIDLGMVPVPIPVESATFSAWLWPFATQAPRGNVLLFLEVRPLSAMPNDTPNMATPSTRFPRGY